MTVVITTSNNVAYKDGGGQNTGFQINQRWTYQDFSAGTITGTSVTLTANERGVNEDGSPLSFDSSKIISSTALILRSDNNKAVQRNGITGFLGKVKVASHDSGGSVTLSHVPNASAPIRIWYHYSELASNIKNQTAVPPMFTGKQIEDMETIFNSKADASLASVAEASSSAQITTSDTVLTAFGKIMKYITDFLSTFNSANKLVQLDGAGLLPAVDGSQLTNLPSSSAVVYSGTFNGSSTTQLWDDDYITIRYNASTQQIQYYPKSGQGWGYHDAGLIFSQGADHTVKGDSGYGGSRFMGTTNAWFYLSNDGSRDTQYNFKNFATQMLGYVISERFVTGIPAYFIHAVCGRATGGVTSFAVKIERLVN